MTIENLNFILGLLAIIWYYFCLIKIGTGSINQGTNQAFYQFMTTSLTSLGTSLATYVGMLLGLQSTELKVDKNISDVVEAAEITRDYNLATSDVQWAAAGLYVLSLLLAIFFWYRRGQNTDPAISNLGKSLLGLLAGALTIALNLAK